MGVTGARLDLDSPYGFPANGDQVIAGVFDRRSGLNVELKQFKLDEHFAESATGDHLSKRVHVASPCWGHRRGCSKSFAIRRSGSSGAESGLDFPGKKSEPA